MERREALKLAAISVLSTAIPKVESSENTIIDGGLYELVTTDGTKQEMTLDEYWIPDGEPVKMKIDPSTINDEIDVVQVEELRLINRPFNEVLEEKYKLTAYSVDEAVKKLYATKWYGPYVWIGKFIVQATPDSARVIKSKRYPLMKVLQIRTDFYDNVGICKLLS